MSFPNIRTIDDVLPSIKGHDEFFVAERPYGTVINYMVALPDSFDDPIRRECRGIIFYPDGTIMSRPFHKFFNLGEKDETRPENINLGGALLLEKLDGSMMRPVWLIDGGFGGEFWKLGTKMGLTDVAEQADAWVRADPKRMAMYDDFIRDMKYHGLTPIFEWVSRQQRIVVDYPRDDLIITAVRNNITGEYVSHHILPNMTKIPIVKRYAGKKLDEILEQAKTDKDREGWVARWPDGFKVKIKLDWYVALHKAKESIGREKYVIEAILDDFIDDLKGKLLDIDRENVEQFEKEFKRGLNRMVAEATHYVVKAKLISRKDFALNTDVPQWIKTIVFSYLDKKIETVYDGVVIALKKLTRTQPEIDANRHLWGGAKYVYGGTPVE